MKHDDMPEKIYVYKADELPKIPYKAYKADGKPDPEDTEYIRKSTADAALLSAREALDRARYFAANGHPSRAISVCEKGIAQIDSLTAGE